MTNQPPLIKGGQNRTATELTETATTGLYAACMFVSAVLWLVIEGWILI